MGTVTGLKREDGRQTLEVQYSQGRIRFQAEGDFQVGEKVRLSFPGNGAVQVEKGQNAEGPADWQGVGYTLPRNLGALNDLRAFEEQLVRWMGGRPQPGAVPAAVGKDPFARLTLPQLLMQAMERKGGKDFLAQSLANLDPSVVSALLDSLDEAEGDPSIKAALSDLLRSLGRGADAAPQASARPAPASGAFLTAEAGAGHAPWFGRIAARSEADGILFASNRMGYAGAGSGKGEPVYRYMLDMGGSSLEVYSSQAKEPGEFADFALERHGGRLEARFSDPAASLPAGLRTAIAGAPSEARQGMVLASHYLQEFQSEPYFGKLVEDFGTVLSQSGLLAPPGPGQPAAIPKQEQVDELLKLFVSFPRDADAPAAQAKAWGDAVRDPKAMEKLLQALRPQDEAALLRTGTSLRAVPGADARPAAAEALLAAMKAGGEGPEAAAALLRKLLPESFKPEDLLRLAKDAALPAGKEHEAAKFLLQAVANSLPQNAPIPEGTPTQFYYYQGQEWRNLQVTWRREGGGKDARNRKGPEGPLQVKVETQSKHMGRVNVGVSWEPKGARLDFKNQHQDVRELLSQSLPELEKSLALLDFKVTAWTYELLPNEMPSLPDPGWTRPASLSDGAHLDLKG
jgi:hypothetical protein